MTSLKPMTFLRSVLGKRVKRPLILARLLKYDKKRFLGHYAAPRSLRSENQIASITALYHVIEKGLSFRDSRALFGKDNVRLLLRQLGDYVSCQGNSDHVQWQSAMKVLAVYIKRHDQDFHDDPYLIEVKQRYRALEQYVCKNDVGGGTIQCTKRETQERARMGFPELVTSRCSVRHFSAEAVSDNAVEMAVRWAQKSPSVCNRQSGRVHAYRDKGMIAQILAIHGGTRGFTEQIDVLLVVAGDLQVFMSPVEHNQVFTDSGMFGMNLLYGLHYQGLGACPLHWCVSREKDLMLRSIAGIPDSETITMLVGVGSLPDTYRVAYSQRRDFDSVLKWH